jgi:hypothetical protein
MIARPAGRLRHRPNKVGLLKIKFVDKGIDESSRIIGAHVILYRLGQQQCLGPVHAFNMCHPPISNGMRQPNNRRECSHDLDRFGRSSGGGSCALAPSRNEPCGR